MKLLLSLLPFVLLAWLPMPTAKQTVETLPILSGYDCLRAANLDCKSLPPKRQRFARYLTAGHEPLAAERLKLWQGCTWIANHLSSTRGLYPLMVVPNTDGAVMRVMLDDYGISPAAWDYLAENGSGPVAEARTPDGYYHLSVDTYADARPAKPIVRYNPKKEQKPQIILNLPDAGATVTLDGKVMDVPGTRRAYVHSNTTRVTYEATVKWSTGTVTDFTFAVEYDKDTEVTLSAPETSERKTKLITLPALALDGGTTIAETIALTGTQSPLLRADWFCYYASQAPAYYQFLSMPSTLGEIEKYAFARLKETEEAGASVWGIVLNSGVAFHVRRLRGYRIIVGPNGGYLWLSDDVLASTGDRDYLANPLNPKADAHEGIFSMRNGLQGYFITDGQGKRLDVVNSLIALDRETKLNDRNLQIRNCGLCHSQGLRPVNDEVRLLANPRLTLGLPDPATADRIAGVYLSADINVIIQRDNAAFCSAALACNGMTAEANSSNMEAIFRRYWDAPVTLEMLANELACDAEKLVTAVQKPIVVPGAVSSPVVAIQLDGLTRNPSRPMLRSQVETVYGGASVLMTGGRK